MKKYNFVSTDSNGDMILGLGFPAALILPTTAVISVCIYIFEDYGKIVREKQIFVLLPVLIGLMMTYFFIRRLRKSTKKNYQVELEKSEIKIMGNGYELISGKIDSCEIVSSNDKLVRVDIYIHGGKISFRCRPEKYKTITGNLSFNPFGNCSFSDMECLLDLGNAIIAIIRETEGQTKAVK